MTTDIAVLRQEEGLLAELVSHFPIIQNAAPRTQGRFLDFIQNPNTRFLLSPVKPQVRRSV